MFSGASAYPITPASVAYADLTDVPTTGEALRAGIGTFLYGPGSTMDALNAASVVSSGGSPITQQQWESQLGGLEGEALKGRWEEGMTQEQADIILRSARDQRQRDLILERATGLQKAGAVAAGFGAAIFDPVNVLAGLLTGGIGEAIGPIRSLQRFKTLYESSILTRGAVQGVGGAALTEPLAHFSAAEMGQDYTWADSAINLGTSAAFSIGLEAIPKAYRAIAGRNEAKFVSSMADNAQLDLIYGRDVVPENLVAEVAAQEKVDLASNIDSVKRAMEDTRSKLSFEMQKNAKLHDDIAYYEREARLAEYGLRDEDMPEGVAADDVWSALNTINNEGQINPADETRAPLDSLLSFIRKGGGVRDEGGEVKNLGITGRTLPGLLNNKSGQTLDDLGLKLQEAGYFGYGKQERPTVNDVIELLREAIAQKGVKKPDLNVGRAVQFLEENGIDYRPYIEGRQANAGNVAEIRAEVDRARSQVTGDDILKDYRDQIERFSVEIARMPRDATMLKNGADAFSARGEGQSSVYSDLEPGFFDRTLTDLSALRDGEAWIEKEITDMLADRDEAFLESYRTDEKAINDDLRKLDAAEDAAYKCLARGED